MESAFSYVTSYRQAINMRSFCNSRPFLLRLFPLPDGSLEGRLIPYSDYRGQGCHLPGLLFSLDMEKKLSVLRVVKSGALPVGAAGPQQKVRSSCYLVNAADQF